MLSKIVAECARIDTGPMLADAVFLSAGGSLCIGPHSPQPSTSGAAAPTLSQDERGWGAAREKDPCSF
ncbi:hypothetical protein DL89DRAFT_270222 [Linderina pennispora]|uniref:Uncharacterized protein n=1 Tax=Linderina pennispora TaxID=61395 RepID=A0A1Y1VYF5_9FUNG|nr:uncharacterized protein DL89DRAFT_270222 [Linderina pennispora]ORX66287.1 hypothetical protein DL89DRAFT_270222 [Linderina pennispora]